MQDITQLLRATERGDVHAAEALLVEVYQELRRTAAYKMAGGPAGQTLQPTALVHEAWLRLGPPGERRWDNRGHFFAAAAEAMRNILIDKARRRRRIRHGGEQERVEFDELELVAPEADERMLQVHDALDQLVGIDPIKAEIVKLRFFVGFTDREVAEALGLSERTVERHWAFAKAWLIQAIRESARTA